jgi:hypothetical protein
VGGTAEKGRSVMVKLREASAHLKSVTLEMGGSHSCIEEVTSFCEFSCEDDSIGILNGFGRITFHDQENSIIYKENDETVVSLKAPINSNLEFWAAIATAVREGDCAINIKFRDVNRSDEVSAEYLVTSFTWSIGLAFIEEANVQ